MSNKNEFEAVIGLEVHAQLSTRSKAYSSDLAEYGGLPNTHISTITLGHPGTLPRINKRVAEFAMRMGIACHSEISQYNIYDRKNYFYPDLPKGYQITQDKTPICKGGFVTITLKDGSEKDIEITRIHMEEDAGKSMHIDGQEESFVDFNRAGVALIEIVSEPVIKNADEAAAYMMEIRKLVRYLDICDGNLEEGSLRCDANISVRPKGADYFNKKVEVKNMNSFKNVHRAISHEIERQTKLYSEGGTVEHSETRNFDPVSGNTIPMRIKEEMNDYRYFPEPDLPPLIIDEEWIEKVKSEMPALPRELYRKFRDEYKLPKYDAGVLTESKGIAHYFEELCAQTDNKKQASNWVMGPVKSYLNDLTLDIQKFPISAKRLSELLKLIEEGKLSNSIAEQRIFPEMIKNANKDAETIAREMNLLLDAGGDDIGEQIDEILSKFPEKVAEYKNGKKGLLGMFMGQLMKETKGKLDPKTANKLLTEKLEN
ncbi:MAG: Asp-tRNA(Asn)/Glu-tRNA(Gln) amidotransferase subunit GatB [Cytophagales bacterium]